MASLQETRARLVSHFPGDSAKTGSKWEELWLAGDFLPWDKGTVNPALTDTLTDRLDLIGQPLVHDRQGNTRRRSAFVPGCGRGYDVLLFASFGFDAYGLEVSESAVKRGWEENEKNESVYPVKDSSVGKGTVAFIQGDFFADDWLSQVGQGKFDLIYDHTFLSALPPDLRPAWALRMSQLLAEDGRLICLEFPSAKDPKLNGPPWALPPAVYEQHLSKPGEKLPYDAESGSIIEDSPRRRNDNGLTRVAHWQPIRTHDIGKDTDWISIWRHRQ